MFVQIDPSALFLNVLSQLPKQSRPLETSTLETSSQFPRLLFGGFNVQRKAKGCPENCLTIYTLCQLIQKLSNNEF